MSQIPHKHSEGPVIASGGTLENEVQFDRDKATLSSNHTLHLPSDTGAYVFTKDSKDSISTSMNYIQSFLVGPIFHLPEDTSGSDEMKHLIEKYDVVLLVTLIDENGDDHYLHYVLEYVK